MTATPTTVRVDGREHVVVDHLLPRDARAAMLDDVLAALAGAGVRGFVVKPVGDAGTTVGVPPGDRARAMDGLRTLAGPGVHLQEWYADAGTQPVRVLDDATLTAVPARCRALRVARFCSVAHGALLHGLDQGVRVEFWEPSAADAAVVEAPGENAASQYASRDLLAPAEIVVEGRARPSIALFARRLLGEVDFPIDAVYTWVDGDDPAWRERMLRARAELDGVEFHPESHGTHRFVSRDELRYSMRSLEMYAPWVRRVFLVTDGQVPAWLDHDHPRVTVVDHREIFDDPSVLPVFNSSAIISRLHHVEGLAEHYLYLNDDIFFGRDVRPEHFFLGSGLARVFPNTLTRPFLPPGSDDAPHVNITKNIRAALEAELGVSVSTAIRHTPYPQLRSVNLEIEQRFGDVLRATAARRFRHHLDVAQDQLFHYYAQATGRAVPVPPDEYGYSYANVGAASTEHKLRRLLATRGVDSFCLNDAPEPDEAPMDDADVTAFLRAYFPLPAPFERPDDGSGA